MSSRRTSESDVPSDTNALTRPRGPCKQRSEYQQGEEGDGVVCSQFSSSKFSDGRVLHSGVQTSTFNVQRPSFNSDRHREPFDMLFYFLPSTIPEFAGSCDILLSFFIPVHNPEASGIV